MTLVPAQSLADLKYWTTGECDADAYVQDGLVLHYDGIRNQGLDKDHSASATTWVNLAPGGGHDVTLYAGTTTTAAGWEETGYRFGGKAAAHGFYGSNLTIPATYTMQAYLDLKTADQNANDSGYVFFPTGSFPAGTAGVDTSNRDYWRHCSFNVRSPGVSSGNRLRFNNKFMKNNADLTGTVFTGGYTALMAGEWDAIFAGSTPPTTGGSFGQNYQVRNTSFTPTAYTVNTYGIGAAATSTSAGQPVNGLLKNFRFYGRPLETTEMEWNRLVDEARFNGGTMPRSIAVTNAVIASNYPTVYGAEKPGSYAVASAGHTFSAPASKTVNNREYTLAGYTLETWDGDSAAWVSDGEGVHSGSSVTVGQSDSVRITWQWSAGDGIIVWDAADYVQDGLVLNYDGIRNAGLYNEHDSSATTWVNIAPAGGWDAKFGLRATGAAPGQWIDDGYVFEGHSYFAPGQAFTIPATETVQAVLDVEPSDNKASDMVAYFWFCSNGSANDAWTKGGALSIRRNYASQDKEGNWSEASATWIDWATQGYGSRVRVSKARGNRWNYVTAIKSGSKASVFEGVDESTKTGDWNGLVTLTTTPADFAANNFGIGGDAGSGLQKLTGALKAFRLYNRELTHEEIVHNRLVDDYRYFGRVPVTNVIVATSHKRFSGADKAGNYQVSGKYTFEASDENVTDDRGFEYEFAGYTLETWDATNLRWSEPVAYSGASYTWTDGSSDPKVRLTWRWKPVKSLFTAADYGLDDIVPAGLVLHYDAIQNGVEGLTRSVVSESWKNLATPGYQDLALARGGTANTAPKPEPDWKDDGFECGNGMTFFSSGLLVPGRQTTQSLVDAKPAEQVGNFGYVWFASQVGSDNSYWSTWSVSVRKDQNPTAIWYNTHVANAAGTLGTTDRPKWSGTAFTYMTAIANVSYTAMFEGTKEPTATPGRYGVKSGTEFPSRTTGYWALGGQGTAPSGGDRLVGTIRNFRLYDRVLTEEELVRNRNVDSCRYFGALATTNVLVVAGGGTQAEAEGAYRVEGSWEFSAETALTAKSKEREVMGYTLETLEDGAWSKPAFYSGKTFVYEDSLDAKPMRLTWKPIPDGMVVILR